MSDENQYNKLGAGSRKNAEGLANHYLQQSNDLYWFTTFTGKKFYPFSPRIEDIDIVDIAHSLSLICRFQGHLPEHYSVAQHSVLVSYLVPRELALEGLLHDSAEAYIGDLIRPIKRHPMMSWFGDVERQIELKINHKFKLLEWHSGFSSEKYNAIKRADSVALMTEKRDLFKVAENQVWTNIQGDLVEPASNVKLKFMHPAIAEQQFMHRYEELKRV